MPGKLIHFEVVPCTVEDFRRFMEELQLLQDGIWESSDGKRLAFFERPQISLKEFVHPMDGGIGKEAKVVSTPTKGSWCAFLSLPSKITFACAGIEARERLNGQTLLAFKDGYTPIQPRDRYVVGPKLDEFYEVVINRQEPIGPAFEKFCQWLLNELYAWLSEAQAETRAPDAETAPPERSPDRATGEIEQEIEHLDNLRARHQANIRKLEERLALYGMAPPLHLVNELELEQKQLQEVEAQLAALRGRRK